MPTSTWENLPQEKRSRVLAAARSEFAVRGFATGSLNVIAAEAGVSKGSLFQYFADKADLVDTVLRTNAELIVEHTLGRVSVEGKLFDVLDRLVVRWIDYFASDPEARGISLMTGLELDDDLRRRSREASRDGFRGALLPLVNQAITTGELRADSDPDGVLSAISMVLRHVRIAAFEPDYDPGFRWVEATDGERHTFARGYVDLLRRGFGAT